MNEALISKLAQRVMILTCVDEQQQRDTMRVIVEDYGANGSYEQIVQIVEECSMVAKLDVINFWEQLAFGWAVGMPMGYDDFAMYAPHRGLYALSPIFSFDVATECEQLPLTLGGKCKGLTRSDFEVSMKRSGLRAKIINGLFTRLCEALPAWLEIVDSAEELTSEQRAQYKAFLTSRIRDFEL